VQGLILSNHQSLVEILYALQTASPSSFKEKAWEAVRATMTIMVRVRDFRRIRSKIDESDIIQQSLIDLQQSINNFSATSDAQAQHWLSKIVQNNLLDAHRQFCVAKCRTVDAEMANSPDFLGKMIDQNSLTASTVFMRSELDLELLDAVAKLPLTDQKILEFRHKKGMTFSAIGKELCLSEQAVRKRWNRILTRLQKALKSRPNGNN
jgi:RNA polymerase sigma-70 factor, ECF subfamily